MTQQNKNPEIMATKKRVRNVTRYGKYYHCPKVVGEYDESLGREVTVLGLGSVPGTAKVRYEDTGCVGKVWIGSLYADVKTITLTEEQMKKVYRALGEIEENEDFDLEVDFEFANGDCLTVYATGRLTTEGYREDDHRCGYENGTGAWVETYRHGTVELSAAMYDAEGNEIECELDAKHERDAEKWLNAA